MKRVIVSAFTLIAFAVLFVGLDYSDTAAQQAPKVVRKSILLGEFNTDHGQDRSLPFVNAHKEMRYDNVLDVSSVELREELLTELLYSGLYVGGG